MQWFGIQAIGPNYESQIVPTHKNYFGLLKDGGLQSNFIAGANTGTLHLILLSRPQISEPNFRRFICRDDSVSGGDSWWDISQFVAKLRGGETLTGCCFFSDKSTQTYFLSYSAEQQLKKGFFGSEGLVDML